MAPLMVWAAVILTLLNLGTTIWALLNSGTKRNETRIAAATAQVEVIERRMQRVEDHVSGLPGGESMARLELSMAHLQGQLGVLDERLKPVASMAARMQEWMLEKGH